MKFKFPLLFFCGLLAVGLLTNSCEKVNQNNIPTLFTGGKWQLASVTVTTYLGASLVSQQALDTACNLTQFFTFNADKTCSYSNFACLSQQANGHWSLSPDELFLYSDIKLDTAAAKSGQPFQTAQIINLGQYSLILQTGDLQTYYLPTQTRVITQYGFVRVKSQ